MSLISFIEKIQNKPRHIRVQILWLSVSLAMFFVVSGWVIYLNHSLLPLSAKSEPLETEESKNLPSLIESFKASIGSFFQKSKEELLNTPENTLQAPEDKTQIQENNIGSERKEEEIQPAELPLSR
ncbi:MAG: hypothetical protein CO003_01535 [Candidatus Portnoybacteria bacterium CG_4_8_14_3_um_filter_44_15]|uniref:Uncharacterized protein n=4 Tax=Candidatus Portnoyibacteriota TaxID=1817913 RepID=A0A2M7YKV3_9BACT|nr:MAG: hypothetical protein AUJ11_02165 [Parcubacteria group bacterium CG1_02_44_65]PIP15831.1 MAG: hypothetical protein COX45_00990 [Candidatus Portnoybacteria bacterium CG23_combo_of_CG06-09_8_20_14_all_44_36]PIW74666.1 MAG: hypothetical protein CO003_01535 [Candidatus Portnoybacteria bacterium CG_4_8_14_3_um_filter_44_15]PIZ69387.1 MAG: hypothetical protein COY10_01620 [Candidatus Portnoybacteria bacterium CG_4_10_14_0_2_um_filter_43_36]PJA63586.1 MAG: hypothetical protein CO160_02650 [Cand